MVFEEELKRIQDKIIRDRTRYAFEMVPGHFWTKPSSSSGKYHLPDEHGQGGLVLHVKRTAKAAEVFLKAWFTPIDFNIVRSAVLLHDIRRFGETEEGSFHSLRAHPELGYRYLLDLFPDDSNESWQRVADCVKCHMGRWGGFPPVTDEAWVVHLSDMVASQYRTEIE